MAYIVIAYDAFVARGVTVKFLDKWYQKLKFSGGLFASLTQPFRIASPFEMPNCAYYPKLGILSVSSLIYQLQTVLERTYKKENSDYQLF